MTGSRLGRVVAVAALAVLAACGSDAAGSSSSASAPPASSSAQGGGISSATSSTTSAAFGFEGNDTCPAAGQNPYDPSPPQTAGPPVGQVITEMPHAHVAAGTSVNYLHNPPTSGCHWSSADPPAPLRPGVYTAEPRPEQWVHNLEHGYVVVLYNCPQGCASDIDSLRAWVQSLPPDPQGAALYPKILVVPDTSMPVHYACVSWDWYLGLDTFDLGHVQAFYANHAGHSPEGAAAG